MICPNSGHSTYRDRQVVAVLTGFAAASAAAKRIPELLATPAAVRFLSCEPLLEGLDLEPWLATGLLHWVICGGES